MRERRPNHPDRSDLDALGAALLRRADDVLAIQERRTGLPLRHIGDAAVAATRSFARWLQGELPDDAGIRELTGSGAVELASGRRPLCDTVKLSYAWRDGVIEILDEEAARLGVDPATVARAHAVARASCDAFNVLLAEHFDRLRAELQAQVDAQHAELHRRATTDALTGVANRTAVLEALARDLERARGTGRRLGIVFVDLDRFKGVNDRLGHACGDEVLGAVGRRLATCVRPGDVLGRIGGDEFVIVCGDLDPTDAESATRAIAERVRLAVLEGFDWDGETIRLSVSVGIAVSDELSTPDALLAAADAAMYRAKAGEGDRIEVARRP